MATFEEKIEHACRTFSISIEELCEAIKIPPLALHLHATDQRNLAHNEMVLLCQYFDVMGNYFTNPDIRFVDVDALPEHARELISNKDGKKSITCYEVTYSGAPDMTVDDLVSFFTAIKDKQR